MTALGPVADRRTRAVAPAGRDAGRDGDGRQALDLSVYLVTDPSARHGVIETALAAARGGASLVQLRDKRLDDADLVALGRALVAALAPYDVPLIVNDRVSLVAAIGAAGAHVGQSDTTIAAARRALGPHAVLGLSIENAAQLDAVGDDVDYLGVGPMKATTTKRDHAPPLGLDGIAALCAATPLPCVAIGGIAHTDVADLKRAGADGVAVVSAICAADDPEAATRRLVRNWRDA